MNKRRLYRAVFVLGTVGLLIVGACGLWLRSERGQEALNRQLIAALVQNDPEQALTLVKLGADPNTPYKPLPAPSLRDLWNYIIHRSAMPKKDTPSAFEIACGAFRADPGFFDRILYTEAPQLVQAMLQHGANKNAQGTWGRTPLMWSVWENYPKTVEVLLHYRVDLNVQDYDGRSALRYAVEYCPDRGEEITIIRQLLAQEVNLVLPDKTGVTPLQFAQRLQRPDIVALLKQAGAKK